jgi:hypothetical protein
LIDCYYFRAERLVMNGVYTVVGGESAPLYSWQEVTATFLDSCHQLHLGELLHDDMFGLFEVNIP